MKKDIIQPMPAKTASLARYVVVQWWQLEQAAITAITVQIASAACM